MNTPVLNIPPAYGSITWKAICFAPVLMMILVLSCDAQIKTKEAYKKTSTTKGHTEPLIYMENKKNPITCKLTSRDLQERKEQVIASLKKKILGKQELHDGYRYRFWNSDEVFDELVTFIKTEKQCCDFFILSLSVSDESIWLSIRGPEGAKEFIKMEMEL